MSLDKRRSILNDIRWQSILTVALYNKLEQNIEKCPRLTDFVIMSLLTNHEMTKRDSISKVLPSTLNKRQTRVNNMSNCLMSYGLNISLCFSLIFSLFVCSSADFCTFCFISISVIIDICNISLWYHFLWSYQSMLKWLIHYWSFNL